MGLGTDLLCLRRSRTSSVASLISGIERLATAQSETTRMMRAFALTELGDAVLAQVAVHALEACWCDAPLHQRRRVSSPSRRRYWGTDMYQQRLFA
jgi:hypothetical protein